MGIGHEVDFIDYWPKYHHIAYNLFSVSALKKRSTLGKVKYILYFLIKFRRLYLRRRSFLNFIHKTLILPRTSYNNEIFNNKQYDVVVYGSDQIWRNLNLSGFHGFDKMYFADKQSIADKHISYAASMGEICKNEEEIRFLKKSLLNFNAISVRENNLKDLIINLGFQVELVLDPVFILNRLHWKKLINRNLQLPRKPYVLFYHLIYSKEAIKYVNKIALEMNLDIVEIPGEIYPFAFGKRYAQTISPQDFITYINYASYVVSTSFHGVAFSLIFKKQFTAIGMGSNSERTISLLTLLDIRDRYFCNEYNYKKIDYKKVTPTLDKYIKDSTSYLMRNL
jgi:hypothetical protein